MNKKKSIILGISILLILIIGFTIISIFNNKKDNLQADQIVNEENKEGHTSLDSTRTLVIYFSENSSLELLAKAISDEVGGDFKRLEPMTPYPSGEEFLSKTKEERDKDIRPKYKDLNINIDDYDTIFIGYPILHYTLPMILYTFFDDYDLSNKTIIPFNSHEGIGNGGTYVTIASLEPNAKILDGLAVNEKDIEKDASVRIKNWFKELGILS